MIHTFSSTSDKTMAVIEKVSAMPKQGVTSMFRFGMSWGLVRGICSGLRVPYTLVRPQTWKKEMMPDMKEKGQSIDKVRELMPYLQLPLKKDHNKADALLLAVFGARMLKNDQI